jgi:hypothetical protein
MNGMPQVDDHIKSLKTTSRLLRREVLLLSYAINGVRSGAGFAEQELSRTTNASRTAGDSHNQIANRSNAGANHHRNHAGASANVDNRQPKRAVGFHVGHYCVDCGCRRHGKT